MTYGISTITNANDEVIIDDTHVPLRIVAEGTIARDGNNQYRIPVPSGLPGDPIVFIAWPIGPDVYVNSGISGGTYTVTAALGNGSPSLSYYVCAVDPINALGVGYGMAIYNAAGQIVFSSGVKHMRMVGLINAIGTGTQVESPGPFTHNSTPTLYPMTVPRVRVIGSVPPQQLPPFGGWVIAGGRRVSATSFDFEVIQTVPKNQILGLGYPIGGSEFLLIGSVI